MAALFGAIIVLPLILQQVMHAEPLYVGLLLLPGGLLTGLLGPVVGRLYDRVGPRGWSCPARWPSRRRAVRPAGRDHALVVAADRPPVLSLGLAFMFTPLFTTGLGALPPHLYSHGSAMVGTVQQVAGAAGTALFVTVMSTVAAGQPAGTSAEVALATGARTSFMTVGVIWVAAIVASFFLSKPEETAPAHEAVPAAHA